MLNSSFLNIESKSGKGIHSTNPSQQPIVGGFIALFNFIIGAGAIPIRLLLRKDMGERSIGIFAFILALAGHIYYLYEYIVIYSLLPLMYQDNLDSLNLLTVVVFVCFLNPFIIYLLNISSLGLKHFRVVYAKAKANVVEDNSYSRGTSRLFKYKNYQGKQRSFLTFKYLVNETTMRMIVEPMKMLGFGATIFLVSLIPSFSFIINSIKAYKILSITFLSLSATGLVIMLSAICLFIEEFSIFMRIRGAALDMIDAEHDLKIIIEEKEKLLQGKKRTLNNDSTKSNNTQYPLVKNY